MFADEPIQLLGLPLAAALGAVAVVVGYALVDHGLMESFLRSIGMEYEDLF